MIFRRIEKRELQRLIPMIRSEDSEMRELAIKILNTKSPVRLSMLTYFSLHLLLTTIAIAFTIFLAYRGAGWYMIPLVLGNLFQILFSFLAIMDTAEERKENDKISAWIME